MSLASAYWPTTPLVLQGGSGIARLSRSEFAEFCRLNRDVRIERTAQGDLNILPPTGGETGFKSGRIFAQLSNWSEADGTGLAFDSSTGFWLPNGSAYSPDSSWVRRERWEALSESDREGFPPLAPDFVVELRSKSDRLADLQEKMREYAENGVRLGWLVDATARRVEIYRPGLEPEIVENQQSLSAEPELPGFVLDLSGIW